MVKIFTNNDSEIFVNEKLVFKTADGNWLSQMELTDLEVKYAKKHIEVLGGEFYKKEPCQSLDVTKCKVYRVVKNTAATCETTALKCADCGLEGKPQTDC